MAVSEVEIAHRILRLGSKHPLTQRVVDSDAIYKGYRLAQSVLRTYRDLSCPKGRYDWNSTEDLTNEAIRRGAMQKPNEFTALLDKLKEKPPKNILEIGTAHGGTFFALAHIAMSEAKLISIDLPGGEYGGGYTKRGKKRIESYGLPTQQINLLQADSHSAETKQQVIERLDGEQLDFLMIDGDHSREGVEQDWEMYSPLVADEGLIAFHDIVVDEADPKCQVSALWKEVKDDHDTQEFVVPALGSDTQWGGIGLVIKSSAGEL